MDARYSARRHGDYETAMAFLIISLLVGLMVNILMVWAVFIKTACLLLPWLVYQLIFAASCLIGPVIGIYTADYQHLVFVMMDQDRRWQVFLALFPIGMGVLGLYFWMVVVRVLETLDAKSANKVDAENADMHIHIYNNSPTRRAPDGRKMSITPISASEVAKSEPPSPAKKI